MKILQFDKLLYFVIFVVFKMTIFIGLHKYTRIRLKAYVIK